MTATRISAAATERSAGGRITRFNFTERAVHWTQAISFLVLLLSGFALALPQIEAVIGHRALLREIHLSGAFFFFFGPGIIALAGDRRSIALDIEAVDTWDVDDFRWLIPFPLLRLFGVRTPSQGRYNAGQKLNALFVVWSTLTFTLTGLIMWQNRRFPLFVVSQANVIHTALAYFALVAFLGHLYLATAYPKTRHAFRAITQGWVRIDWAEHHHVKWLRRYVPSPPAPAYDAPRTAVQILLGSFIALFAVRILFFAIGANVTDKVTTWLYDVTAWPGLASIHPQTAIRMADWPAVIYLIVLTAAWLAVDRLRSLRPSKQPVDTVMAGNL